ncbi:MULTISPECIES: RNA 2'-phosphotransferase [Lysobacter]|jgi:putative RNA 2'-phosphotransferase|uniref:RNA 2'-phosphotransferase n=1 Tax=Lysobacter TaxID=68 RepID=UPI001F31FB73|nr:MULTISPECIES: RNA 2'-phosphotransferase [Lysobacter]UJB17943.1 RNA 2'-phosphotransferase [Lysobacter capsici]UJQ28334.1 RNA 2'-phosphotransferase [Lysobacter gummosus]
MTAVSLTKTSKFLSLVLRHEPEAIGLTLDANGWADIEELIDLANASGKPVTRALIDEVVRDNDKQRFAISEDGLRIRANQGHSIEVDLALTALEPPATLYHGTATRFAKSIRNLGLVKQSRQHVHLSSDQATAIKVGSRHGKPLVLKIRSGEMHARGLAFFRSENGVWLTEAVAAEFIDWPEQG